MIRQKRIVFLALATCFAVAVGACSNGDGDPAADAGIPDGGGDAAEPGDDGGSSDDGGTDSGGPGCGDGGTGAPPTVVSFDPEDGATAVGQADPIQITFSEAMDEASTEAAIQITGAVSQIAMSWNVSSTVLTITSNKSIDTGFDPETVSALSVTITVGACAMSAAGNLLGEPVSATFSMMRGIRVDIEEEVSGLFGHSTDGGSRFTFLCAGDSDTDAEIRGAVTYDLSVIPENTLGIATAHYTADVYRISGDPFAEFGALLIEHVTFDTWAAAFDAPEVAGHSLWPLLDDGVTVDVGDQLQENVTLAVQSDWENRVARMYRSQYRFRYEGSPGENETRDDLCMRAGDTPENTETGTPFIAGARLSVIYLVE
jgi:hypothetical protein